MRFRSQDLGRFCIKVDTVLQDDFETENILVVDDCEENGLIHVYYGESLPQALEAIEERLEDFDEQEEVINEVVQFFRDYESKFLQQL